MDPRDAQNGTTDSGNVLIDPGAARASGAGPAPGPAPSIPGGPYAPYQPGQAAPYSPVPPAAPQAPAPIQVGAQRQGLRDTNPVLWTVLIIFGVLLTGAVILSVVAVLFAARIIGQIDATEVGPLQNESRSVPLGAEKSVDVQLTMRAGELTLAGGAQDLMNADFTYNVGQWKPEISAGIAGETGALIVNQPDRGIITTGKSVNKWNLRLNNGVPLSLKANLGAGDTDFRFPGLNVTRAEIIVGAGDTKVDLTGMTGEKSDIRVINSVGNTTLILPSDVGVQVNTVRGVGNIDPGGLKGSGNTYTNDAYGKAARTINVYAEVAAGDLVFRTR